MKRRSGILCILFLLPILVYGQNGEYLLDGFAYMKDGPKYRYKVTLKIDGNAVTGMSTTTQPTGLDLNALIKGSIDRKHHTLKFAEYKMPLAIDFSNCLFDVQLSYKMTLGNFVFSGTFVGNSITKDSCDAGSVILAINKEAGSTMVQANKKKKQPAEKLIIQEEKSESTPEFEKITATIKKELAWNSDSVVLEIWDGMVVDGDIVTVRLNGRTVLSKYELVKEKKRIVLPVSSKTCTITIYAENEGKAPPNTSMILLTDGKITHGAEAVLQQGETSEIIIRRK